MHWTCSCIFSGWDNQFFGLCTNNTMTCAFNAITVDLDCGSKYDVFKNVSECCRAAVSKHTIAKLDLIFWFKATFFLKHEQLSYPFGFLVWRRKSQISNIQVNYSLSRNGWMDTIRYFQRHAYFAIEFWTMKTGVYCHRHTESWGSLKIQFSYQQIYTYCLVLRNSSRGEHTTNTVNHANPNPLIQLDYKIWKLLLYVT